MPAQRHDHVARGQAGYGGRGPSVTVMAVAPSITWLLVLARPEGVGTIPVPAEMACWWPSVAVTSTRPGSTEAASGEFAGVVLMPALR